MVVGMIAMRNISRRVMKFGMLVISVPSSWPSVFRLYAPCVLCMGISTVATYG